MVRRFAVVGAIAVALGGGCGNDFVLGTSGAGGATSGTGSGSSCGDGVLQFGEQCDDGNDKLDDGCNDLCEVECDDAKGYVYDPATHHCYDFVSANLEYTDARNNCTQHGPGWQLATISGAAELVFIDNTVEPDDDAWIGATDLSSEGDFKWETGEPFDYDGWAPDSPDGGNQENCLQLVVDPDGVDAFDDEQCTAGRNVLCEHTPIGVL